MAPEDAERLFLIFRHEAAVARNVRRQDRCQLALKH
jgi:hypothetical protein